jgi:transglutaminase-like putative cysteine protease
MILEVSHRTHYRYTSPVVQSQHLVHMSPRLVQGQTVRHHSLMIDPAPALRHEGFDAFGNPIVILDIELAHREFSLHARTTIETKAQARLNLEASTAWDELDRCMTDADTNHNLDVIQFGCASRLTPASLEISDYAATSFTPKRPVLDAAMDLTQRIYNDFTFDPTATDVSTPIAQVFKQRRGVCQDFSHFALAALRCCGVPSRYVSGYLLTRPPPGQAKLQGADASHAWISVWSPEQGWIGFDPTNGIIVSDEHVTIAHGRDYDDVSPISGVLIGGGRHTVAVAVDVSQVRGSPG